LTTSPEWRGTITRNSMPRVLRAILRDRRQGTLVVTRDGETRRLFFEQGELRLASSSHADWRMGSFLQRRGAVSREKLEEALATEPGAGRSRLGPRLIEKGFVTREVLDFEMRRLVEEIVFSTFQWDQAEFTFHDVSGRLDPNVMLSLSTALVIVEGIRRQPAREDFVKLLGDLDQVAAVVEDPSSRYQYLTLTPQEAFLLSRCDGTAPIKDLLRIGGSREETAKSLFALLQCGIVETRLHPAARPRETPIRSLNVAVLSPESRPARPDPETSAEHRRLIQETHRRLSSLSAREILGVGKNADRAEIEEAYQMRSRLFHPDLKFRDDLADMALELRRLSEATARAHAELTALPGTAPAARKAAPAPPRDEPLPGDAAPTSSETEAASSQEDAQMEVARRNYLEARRLLELGDYFGAIKYLQESLRFNPGNPEYHFRLAGALARNPHWREQALHHYQEAAIRDPNRQELLSEFAELLLLLGRALEAQAVAGKLLERHPDISRYKHLLARCDEAVLAAGGDPSPSSSSRSLLSRLFRKD